MKKPAIFLRRIAPALLAFAIPGAAFSSELPEVEYRVRVLVCAFDAPGLPPEKGALAAETLAAALEAGGLTDASRPQYKTTQTWDPPLVATQPFDGRKDGAGGRTPAGNGPYVLSEPSAQVQEASRPDADFRVEGAVAQMGEGPAARTWSVRAALYDQATGEKVAAGSASGQGDAGLLEASKAVAAELENAYKFHVLEERTEAVRRSVEIGDLSRATALKRLDAMLRRWPDALPPAAAGLLLASRAKPPDAQAVTQWGARTVERLPEAGLAGKRFVLRLGIGNPYEVLASAYDSAGKKDEAAALRRQAEEEGYARPESSGQNGKPPPQTADPPAK